jgi:hypothetical protein
MSLILNGTDGLSDVDGTAATPAIRGTDTNTGIFFGSDIIGFSEGGAEVARFNADAQFVAAAGTASLPVITTTGDVNTGIFFPAADTIAFSEGGAEAMRIDSSGNVGIGATSITNNKLLIKAAHVSGGAVVGLQTDQAATGSPIYLGFFNSGGTRIGYVGCDTATNMQLVTAENVPLTFGTNNTERMRIDSSGSLLIGATTKIATEKLNVTNTSASVPFGIFIKYTAASPNDNSNEFLYCADSSTNRAAIKSNGGISNYQANDNNLSDSREKKNIELAGNYLDKICAIPVKTFLYNDQTDEDLNLGVMAQDVQAVAPELVLESNWAAKDEPEKMRLSIYQTDLQYALMKSIQELKATVDAQAARIAALEAAP